MITMSGTLVFIGCYIPGTDAPNLYTYRLDRKKGELEPLSISCDVRNPAWLDLHPNDSFLYSVCDVDAPAGEPTGAIATFRIGRDNGRLELLGQSRTGDAKPCHVSVHPSGSCLLSANYSGGNVCMMPIQGDGTAGPPSQAIQYSGSSVNADRQERPHAHSGLFSPDGSFAYVQDLGTDCVRQYRVDAERARLASLDPDAVDIAPGSGPRHLVFHPTGPWVYVINELFNTITCLERSDETGQLRTFQTVPTLPPGFTETSYCADIRVTPDGRFLYGSNRGHDSLVICRVDEETGRLRVLGHQATGGNWPRGFNVDPSGRFAIVANERGDNVLVFAIDSETGALEHTGCTLALPKPVCVQTLG